MLARLDGSNTCTVAQTYTNSVGARVGPLQPKGHEEQVPTFTSQRVSKIDSRQKAHGTRTYCCFRGHPTLRNVRRRTLPISAVNPTRVKRVSSHVKNHLGGCSGSVPR